MVGGRPGQSGEARIFLIQDDNLTAEVPLRRSILQSTLRQKYRSTGRHNPQRDGGPEKGLYRLHPIALMVQPVGLESIKLDPVTPDVFRVAAGGPSGPVIGLIPGKILTEPLTASLPYRDGERHPDPEADILKVCVLSRHGTNRNVGRGFV